MKALPLKIIFLFAFAYGSTSGLSIGKSVKLDIRKVASANISASQPEIHVLDEVKPAAEFKDQPKDGEPSGEKRNLHTLDKGRGKKKKKIKGALFLMMVAMGVKCIMVLKALTIKALLASKIALVLSLLSIMKKLFEKPEQKPQTNIVLKREPEHHHYKRNDYIERIDNGDYWLHDPEERLSQGHATRMRLPLVKGVFDNWRGRYYNPRGSYMDEYEEMNRGYKPKRKKDRPCNSGKGYLLGSLERGRDDLDDQASEHQKIANYELTNTRKIIPIKKSNNSKYALEGNKYPYAKIVGKNQYDSNSNVGLRDWSISDNKQKTVEENYSRETNINKGMINHYDNEVFKGTDWENVKRPHTIYATNNGFHNGRSTQVFANWDAYKKFFGHRRSTEADSERPSVSSGSEIRNRHSYKHRLTA